MVNNKYASNPTELPNEIKQLTKQQATDTNLHEVKSFLMRVCDVEFEMIGTLVYGENTRSNHMSFRKISDYESYINSAGDAYDSGDSIFKGYVFFKKNKSQFNIAKRYR